MVPGLAQIQILSWGFPTVKPLQATHVNVPAHSRQRWQAADNGQYKGILALMVVLRSLRFGESSPICVGGRVLSVIYRHQVLSGHGGSEHGPTSGTGEMVVLGFVLVAVVCHTSS
jgi:hypothetical protein